MSARERRLQHVGVGRLPVERFREVVDAQTWARIERTALRAREELSGRVVWNVSSTARGGGVAEMLHSLIAYARGSGVDARWVVVPGDEAFFRITKRLHNRLHGAAGDGGPLGDEQRRVYEETLAPSVGALERLVRRRDVVVVHDPQPAGMVARLRSRGALVVWRCHVGVDVPNAHCREAWSFLLPYVRRADAVIFSRASYAWEGLEDRPVVIIPPSIDAFSTKNAPLAPTTVEAVAAAAGILPGDATGAVFTRFDGSPGRVDRSAAMLGAPLLRPDLPIVCQVSRWDRLKDHLGVLRAFGEHVAPHHDAQLLLVGPAAGSVTDDPEGEEVLAELVAVHRTLPAEHRARAAIACVPMEDVEENAATINALQRRSAIVAQKSLAEGFGLTVAEAMWKGRPVVAGAVGGIQDQIVDGQSGVLVDPRDLRSFGAAVAGLLTDPERRRRIGEAAHRRAVEEFLAPRQLTQWVETLAAASAA